MKNIFMVLVFMLFVAGCTTPEKTQISKMNVHSFGVGLSPLSVTSYPAYTNGQYYVWDVTNLVTASNSLVAIDNSGWFPIVGNNAKTGEPEPDKTKTTRWVDKIMTRLDGKYVYPRIPTKLMDALGVPEVERQQWWDAFQPDVEQYQNNWFPEEE